MIDSDGFEIGAAKTREKSPITAKLRTMAVGDTVEFSFPLYLSCNAPRSCATNLSRKTELQFGCKVGVRDGQRVVTIKRVK